MLIFVCRGLPRTSCGGFIHFGGRRCSKTCILKFWMARRCSDTHILLLLDEMIIDIIDAFWLIPLRHCERRFFCAKLHNKFYAFLRTAQGSRAAPLTFAAIIALAGRLIQSLMMGPMGRHTCTQEEPSRRIRWVDGTKLWRNANFLWKLSEASRETFVLEALFYEIWRKPRAKRSFWKLVL